MGVDTVARAVDAEAVLEHMTGGVLAFDSAWTCRNVNPSAERLLGCSRDELIGRELWKSPIAPAVARVETDLRRAMVDRETAAFVANFRGRVVEARTFPLPARALGIELRNRTDQMRGEERLRLALDVTDLGTWDYDACSRVLFWDERTRAIYGAMRDVKIGRWQALEHRIPEGDRRRLVDAYRAAASRAAPAVFRCEHRVIGYPDDEERWVLTAGQVVFGRDGRPSRVLGSTLDITERKRAEQRLRQNEERLRLAVTATGLGTWDHDLETGERTWSEAARTLLGLPPEIPATRELLRRLMHPDDEPPTARAYAAALDPDSGGTYRHAFRIRRYDDGAERWLALDGRVSFNATRRPTRALGIVRDVTEAKSAEARLREEKQGLEARVELRTHELESANRALAAERARLWAVLEQLPLGILVVSPSGGLVFQNAAAHRMTGRDLSTVRERRDFSQIGAVHPDGTPLEAEDYALAQAIRSGAVTIRKLQPFATGDGRRAMFEVSSAPVLGPTGAIELGVVAFEDVSSRLDAEEALRRAQRLEAVGQLTGGVAHDFNNLLTVILGTLELLSREVQGVRASRLVENAVRAADRGAKLTAQLLAFARKQRLQTEPVDVEKLVRSMAILLRGTLGGTIEIGLSHPPDLWPALADPTQLELLVLNLAINARDAMPEGGRLTIASGNVTMGRGSRPEDPPPGNFVALTITDTGTGMSPSVLARAFEPFFTTKEVGKGSGLGLAQVLGVAQQLGGGARITSRQGVGTEVTVYLPQARFGVEQRPTASLASRTSSLVGLSVLLVDDDDDVRETTAELLHELGAAVVSASTGIEAIERVDSHFDAVVLDFGMPLMTGAECAEHIRQLYPKLPLLLMTGHTDDLVLPAFCSVLHKPFPTSALAGAIRAAIDANRSPP